MKKAISLTAALVMAGYAAMSPFSGITAENAEAADGYDMTVNVDLAGEQKEISPLIYGVNQYGNQDNLKNLRVNSIRQGGNRMTGYNWETNASNAGSDWKYSSDDNLSQSDDPADCVQELSAMSSKNNIGYKMTTLQLAGYVAADKNGTVTEEETAPSKRWNEAILTKNAPFAEEPDLEDGKVYMDEYVNYIINKLGDSTSPTGIQGYSLDNEPALWNHTHSRIHPQDVGMKELSDKSIEMAEAVKKLDPKAEIFGPALYGYTAYDHLDDTDESTEWEELKSANNYHWYIDYYLDTMKKASDEKGVRLLDVLDIHYYSESARVGAEDRVQSVRTLCEKGFVENSWIGQWCQENVPILPTVQASIDKYFPGTKLGITEYNFGGGTDVSGTIAQVDALGCYADQGVYFATLWGNEPFILSGINLYTNYDGKGGSFGDMLIPAEVEDISASNAYAAVDSGDDTRVTVAMVNKKMEESENASIVLENTDKEYKSAAVYAVYGDSEEIKLLDIIKNVDGNKVNVTLPAFSAAMVVVSENADEFDGLVKFDDIKKEIKTDTFDDPMSMINDNGYVEVPITDPENLKKVIITADVTSSAGSAWATAGCAISINAVDEAGTKFWTSKSYSLGLGSGSTTTVAFDGTLKNKDDEVKAVIADGKIEFQKWWDSSEKAEQEIEDVIDVKYTKIEVVYEYVTITQDDVLMGDANCDGVITIADATAVLQAVGNPDKYELTENGKKNADVDGQSGVTGNDAYVIQLVEIGVYKTSELPLAAK